MDSGCTVKNKSTASTYCCICISNNSMLLD